MVCGLIGARDNARSNMWPGSVVVRSASSLRSIDRVAVLIEIKVERREEEEEEEEKRRTTTSFKESRAESSNFVKLVFR
jgi:hypothetical protein